VGKRRPASSARGRRVRSSPGAGSIDWRYAVTFGAWLRVHPDDLRRAWEVWETPDYIRLSLAGRLANRLPPWDDDVFAKPATAVVKDPDDAPYVVESADATLHRVLEEEWPHELVLGALPSDG
jgi:hypothetical protein